MRRVGSVLGRRWSSVRGLCGGHAAVGTEVAASASGVASQVAYSAGSA